MSNADTNTTEAATNLWRELSETAHHARLAAIDDPSFDTLAHVLGVATLALQHGKLERLDTLLPKLRTLHHQLQAEILPEALPQRLDGPERSDRVKRMDTAAQRWLDAGNIAAVEGVRWVACEAIALFEGEVRENLEDLSLVYEPFESEDGETFMPDPPAIVDATVLAWTNKHQAESHDYVSVVLRAAGVTDDDVHKMFAYKRVAKQRAARKGPS